MAIENSKAKEIFDSMVAAIKDGDYATLSDIFVKTVMKSDFGDSSEPESIAAARALDMWQDNINNGKFLTTEQVVKFLDAGIHKRAELMVKLGAEAEKVEAMISDGSITGLEEFKDDPKTMNNIVNYIINKGNEDFDYLTAMGRVQSYLSWYQEKSVPDAQKISGTVETIGDYMRKPEGTMKHVGEYIAKQPDVDKAKRQAQRAERVTEGYGKIDTKYDIDYDAEKKAIIKVPDKGLKNELNINLDKNAALKKQYNELQGYEEDVKRIRESIDNYAKRFKNMSSIFEVPGYKEMGKALKALQDTINNEESSPEQISTALLNLSQVSKECEQSAKDHSFRSRIWNAEARKDLAGELAEFGRYYDGKLKNDGLIYIDSERSYHKQMGYIQRDIERNDHDIERLTKQIENNEKQRAAAKEAEEKEGFVKTTPVKDETKKAKFAISMHRLEEDQRTEDRAKRAKDASEKQSKKEKWKNGEYVKRPKDAAVQAAAPAENKAKGPMIGRR